MEVMQNVAQAMTDWMDIYNVPHVFGYIAGMMLITAGVVLLGRQTLGLIKNKN